MAASIRAVTRSRGDAARRASRRARISSSIPDSRTDIRAWLACISPIFSPQRGVCTAADSEDCHESRLACGSAPNTRTPSPDVPGTKNCGDVLRRRVSRSARLVCPSIVGGAWADDFICGFADGWTLPLRLFPVSFGAAPKTGPAPPPKPAVAVTVLGSGGGKGIGAAAGESRGAGVSATSAGAFGRLASAASGCLMGAIDAGATGRPSTREARSPGVLGTVVGLTALPAFLFTGGTGRSKGLASATTGADGRGFGRAAWSFFAADEPAVGAGTPGAGCARPADGAGEMGASFWTMGDLWEKSDWLGVCQVGSQKAATISAAAAGAPTPASHQARARGRGAGAGSSTRRARRWGHRLAGT